jgi:hypothetical protein
VARLAPLTIAEVDAAVRTWRSDLAADPGRSAVELRSQLRELHDLLLRTTAVEVEPRETLDLVAGVIATIGVDAIDRLPTRPRIVFRLLYAERVAAAWQVLLDNAAGVVDTGAFRRTLARSPLRLCVEAPAVFAQLPGFRDPRYDAPDSCYDVTDRTRLRAQLEEIEVDPADGMVRFAGWATVDLLGSSADDSVRVLLADHGREVAVAAIRVRRSDRRAWAGWSAAVDVRDVTGIDVGRWGLSIEVDHEGVVGVADLGADSSDLARVTALDSVDVGDRAVRWDTSGSRWRLIVKDRRARGR